MRCAVECVGRRRGMRCGVCGEERYEMCSGVCGEEERYEMCSGVCGEEERYEMCSGVCGDVQWSVCVLCVCVCGYVE